MTGNGKHTTYKNGVLGDGLWHSFTHMIVISWYSIIDRGVSENSVPLNPMVNDHYPYEMAIIGNIPYFKTNP